MKIEEIQAIINKTWHSDWILSTEIKLNQYNTQIDSLKIIFTPDFNPKHKDMGQVTDAIDELIIADEYGDLTILDINYTTFEKIPKDNDDYDLCCSFTLTFNIDS